MFIRETETGLLLIDFHVKIDVKSRLLKLINIAKANMQ